MTQLTLEAALNGVEAENKTWLQWARGMAQTISKINGSVTSDDVREKADLYGLQPDSPKSWGALFIGTGWTRVGRKASTVKTNHSRWINVWSWDGEN